jgi:hypothetical protein
LSVFLDTGFFVAFHNSRDVNHERAVEIMEELLKDEHGSIFTSEYVFDEAVTVALMRTGRHDLAVDLGNFILGMDHPKFVTILPIEKEIFSSTWSTFISYSKQGLSFTDCSSIALIRKLRIKNIVSFDSGFDGILHRIN